MGNLLKTGPGQDPPEAPETAPRPTRAIFSHQLAEQSRMPGTADSAVIAMYATEEELHELAEKVRDRRAKLPRYRYVKCNNPACSRRVRVPYDSPVNEKTGCFTCNFGGFRDVGFMVPMSAKEAAEYDRDEETANRVWLEKREKADLYGTNEKLKAEGKEPITLEQLRAERQHYWKVQQEHTEKMGAKLRAANAEAKK